MKILYPLPTPGSPPDALEMAIDIARAHGGKIRILSIVDTERIRSIEAGATPGAIEIAHDVVEEITARERDIAAESLKAALRRCGEAGVPTDGKMVEGDPREELVLASVDADLLVAGINAHFAFGGEDKPAGLALSLMKDRTVPVLLCASPWRAVRTLAVGCGGGERTLRAVGAMARMGLWKTGVRTVLLAVDDDSERAERKIAGPREVLEEDGYTGLESVTAPMPKIENFLAACKREQVDAVVLGGFGEHRWNDVFGFSITGRMIREAQHHLFLFM